MLIVSPTQQCCARSCSSTTYCVWRYAYADWEKACKLSDSTNWNSLFLEELFVLSKQQQHSMIVIEECIPVVLSPSHPPCLWVNNNLICAIRRRNQLYRKAKQPVFLLNYKLGCNRVRSDLHRVKKTQFGNLNPPKNGGKILKP